MKTALGYVRISGGHLNDRSLIAQISSIRAYAAMHGYELLGILEDRCSSSDLGRLGLNALMQASEWATVDCIVVTDRTRLYRDLDARDRFVVWADEFNVRIEAIDEIRAKSKTRRNPPMLTLVSNSSS